jgi:hypothetical protein
VEPLNEHTNVVTFQLGPRALIQALQFIAHQFRLAQILHHRLLSRYCILSPSLHGHFLPTDHRTFILRLRWCVVSRDRDAQPGVYAHLVPPTAERTSLPAH